MGHVARLGAGPHVRLQRCLRPDDARREAPLGARPAGTRGLVGNLERHRPAGRVGRPHRGGYVGRGAAPLWSDGVSPRRLTILSPTAPCRTTGAASAVCCAWSRRTRSGPSASGGCGRCVNWRSTTGAGEVRRGSPPERRVHAGGESSRLALLLIYLPNADASAARLAGSTGLPEGSPAVPPSVDLSEPGCARDRWQLGTVQRTGRAEVVTDLGERLDHCRGRGLEPPHTAVVLGQKTRAGPARRFCRGRGQSPQAARRQLPGLLRPARRQRRQRRRECPGLRGRAAAGRGTG